MKRIHLKPDAKAKGFYVLEHVATGKVCTGTCSNLQDTILAGKQQLMVGTFPNKPFQKLYNSDCDVKAHYTATANLKEAKALEREYRQSKCDYLLL